MSTRKTSLWRIVSLCLIVCLLFPSVLAAAPAADAEPIDMEPLEGKLFSDGTSAAQESLTLLDPGKMRYISLGIKSAYLNHFPHRDCPDYVSALYLDRSDGTLIISLTDTSEATLDELRADLRASDVKGKYPEWLPMITFRKVRYSTEQLLECSDQVRQLISEAGIDCRVLSRCDPYANQVVLYFDDEDPLVVEDAVGIANKYAETLADEYDMPDMLLAMPYDQQEAYLEEHARIYGTESWKKKTVQDEPPANTDSIDSADATRGVMPGMKNAFYNEDKVVCSGTIGFTAYLIYCGRGNDLFQRGDTVEAIFTHGHHLSKCYPYSTIADGLYSTDLLEFCDTNSDYGFYCLKNGESGKISNKRFGSTYYLDSFCESAQDIEQLLDYDVCFYGNTSKEKQIDTSTISIDGTFISWSDSDAMSIPGDSGGPVYVYDPYSFGDLILIGIVSTSLDEQGGEAQTVYSIIRDMEANYDYEFDSLN